MRKSLKKMLSIVLVFQLFALLLPLFCIPASAASEFLFNPGDVNGNAEVDVIDLLYLQDYILGVRNLTAQEKTIGDINEDKEVDVLDLLLIQKYILGKGTLATRYPDVTDPNITLLSIAGTPTSGVQNVRATPSATGNLLASLAQNSFVHITKIDPDTKWMQVEYDKGKLAYVSFDSSTKAVVTSRVGKLLESKYVHSSAQVSNNVVGTVKRDSFVLIMEKDTSGQWYKILYDGTKVGYISIYNVLIPKGTADTSTTSPNISVGGQSNGTWGSRALANNPGLRNKIGSRGPDAYNKVIDQFKVGQNTWNATDKAFTTTYNSRYNQTYVNANNVYQTSIQATYCNIFDWDVMGAMGVHFPHWAKGDGDYNVPGRAAVKTPYQPAPGASGQSGMYELSANMLYVWIVNYGKDYGWTEVDPTIAQNRANNGFPTVTVCRNKNDSSSGHVQVVRPETSTYKYNVPPSGYPNGTGCVIAQAGGTNFNYGLVANTGAYNGMGIPGANSSSYYQLRYFTHDSASPDLTNDVHNMNRPEVIDRIDPNDPGYGDVVTKPTEPEIPDVPELPARIEVTLNSEIAQVLADGLNVRATATTSGTVLTGLTKDTFVHVVGRDTASGWYKIEYEKGKFGYISNGAAYTKLVPSMIGRLKNGSSLTIRKGPSASGDPIPNGEGGNLAIKGSENEYFLVFGTDASQWYQILYCSLLNENPAYNTNSIFDSTFKYKVYISNSATFSEIVKTNTY